MNRRIQIKVCGITNLPDAALAADLGAAFLGFIFYKQSPRFLSLETFRTLREQLPATKRVYVQVRPDPKELERAADEGFNFFQLHFPVDENPRHVERWAEIVGPEKLWLAPKIAPDDEFPQHLMNCAETFLIDTYRKDVFGGTGQTGDWRRFRDWSLAAPEKRWVLAGGLKPDNVQSALQQTEATLVDVSSGIEEHPGKKDHIRMRQFFSSVAPSA